MKKAKKVFALVLVLILVCCTLAACGDTSSTSNSTFSDGVPQSVAEMLVRDEMEEWGEDDYTFYVSHNLDKESGMDRAVITLTINFDYGSVVEYADVWYSYDKSSDRWILEWQGEWSNPPEWVYYSDALIGHWEFEDGWGKYIVDVRSIDNDTIYFDYSAKKFGINTPSYSGSGAYNAFEYETNGYLCATSTDANGEEIEFIFTANIRTGLTECWVN